MRDLDSGVAASRASAVTPTSAAFPPAPQGFGLRLPRSGFVKKTGDVGPEGVCQLFQNRHGGVFQSTLDATHVGPVHLGVDRQCLLRETSADPQFPNISRYQGLGFHEPKGHESLRIKPRTIDP